KLREQIKIVLLQRSRDGCWGNGYIKEFFIGNYYKRILMTIMEQFIIPKRYNNISIVLMAIGLLAIILLYITHGSKTDPREQARFWGSLLQNGVYFLLLVNTAMFFICATTLAWGGWQMSFRRVSEAISAVVPVIGVIC